MGAPMPPLVTLLGLLALVALASAQDVAPNCAPQQTDGLFPVLFNGNTEQYRACRSFPYGGAFYWNLTADNNVTSVFENTPQKAYGWSARGFSPDAKMVGSTVIVAYGNPAATMMPGTVYPILLATFNQRAFVKTDVGFPMLAPPEVEIVESGTKIRTKSYFLLADRAPKTIIFGKGPGFDFQDNVLLLHSLELPLKNKVATIDFANGDVTIHPDLLKDGRPPTGGFPPPHRGHRRPPAGGTTPPGAMSPGLAVSPGLATSPGMSMAPSPTSGAPPPGGLTGRGPSAEAYPPAGGGMSPGMALPPGMGMAPAPGGTTSGTAPPGQGSPGTGAHSPPSPPKAALRAMLPPVGSLLVAVLVGLASLLCA